MQTTGPLQKWQEVRWTFHVRRMLNRLRSGEDAAKFKADHEQFKKSLARDAVFQQHQVQLKEIDTEIARTHNAQRRMLTESPAAVRQELALPDNTEAYNRAKAEKMVHEGIATPF